MANETLAFGIGPNSPTITVRSWDALLRWIDKEQAKWDWMVPGDAKTDINNWASTVRSQWSQLRNQLSAMKDRGEPLEAAGPALAPLNENGPLLATQSVDGRLVFDIRETADEEAAAFAYAFLRRGVTLNNAVSREMLLGAVLTVLPEFGVPSELANRLRQERANNRGAMIASSRKLDEQEQARADQGKHYLNRGSQIAIRVLRRHRERWKSQLGNWQDQALSAVADIRGVENTYREAMRLRAPVEYWRRKATEHQNKEGKAATRLLVFFPLMTGVLIASFFLGGWIILGRQPEAGRPTPVALYVVVTGALAFISTVAFWIGRLLTKLYLSEHHLRNDADERAIMTETYLALTNESAAGDADRQIILTALFRNTIDGIVKDDGPTDLNAQALLSRLLTK